MTLLSVDNLTVKAGNKTLAQHVSFSISKGEVVCIEGKNGSGKTTLLETLLNPKKNPALKWQIKLDDVLYLSQLQNLGFHIPCTLQDVMEGFSGCDTLSGRPDSNIFFTPDELRKPWKAASGGEKKKTLLTAVLYSPATLFILDEPFNHIDESSLNIAIEALSKRVSQEDKAFIIVNHNAESNLKIKNNVKKYKEVIL